MLFAIYRIIPTIRVQIKSVRCFGVKVIRAIGRNKSSPLGVIVSRVEVVESCILVVVVASIPYRIYRCNIGIGRAVINVTIAIGIVEVFGFSATCRIVNSDYIPLEISSVVVRNCRTVVVFIHYAYNACLVVKVNEISDDSNSVTKLSGTRFAYEPSALVIFVGCGVARKIVYLLNKSGEKLVYLLDSATVGIVVECKRLVLNLGRIDRTITYSGQLILVPCVSPTIV